MCSDRPRAWGGASGADSCGRSVWPKDGASAVTLAMGVLLVQGGSGAVMVGCAALIVTALRGGKEGVAAAMDAGVVLPDSDRPPPSRVGAWPSS